MKETIGKLIETVKSLQAREAGRKLSVGKPCPEEEMDLLEKRINWKLPAEYRLFLTATNGIQLSDGAEACFIDLFASRELPRKIDDEQRETLGEDGVDLRKILVVGAIRSF